MQDPGIELQIIKPDEKLSSFIESYWLLTNHSQQEKPVIILPDGRIDLSFNPHTGVTLLGLETGPSLTTIPALLSMFTISFKPLAVEYLFSDYAPVKPNTATQLPDHFLEILPDLQQPPETIVSQFISILNKRLPATTDNRKKELFDLVFASNGNISVEEISGKVYWSSRQINRYCKQMIGIPLKTYCNILRFRASFHQIKEGKLFPEDHFADQSHFIREIKKFSGVNPKELSRNQNDRFIQFSTLPKR
ncbi:helix-turn-helix domain-containing protein [Pseudobacter ginsenosidimutans]|uniref:AraC-like DNA-binding protein n=1 Tax=Pseudobacter ginsenosidimutans TaxID=661488 RepID=A0A4Q7N1K7_9BACT|nr:AraC family transcriptional regulator [Pseudobacter ginsenosidimutans]QEC44067.1 helix-turn-helix transcriptional regulator [Pseudobacter ginsenosidimutans]RZS75507.1 AraC-like DNA-binding protein [Pseudobacter ginsenosidimutans]